MSRTVEEVHNDIYDTMNNILKNINHNMDDDSQNKFIKYYVWREFGIGECPTGPYEDGFNELAHYVEMLYAEQVQRHTQINGQ